MEKPRRRCFFVKSRKKRFRPYSCRLFKLICQLRKLKTLFFSLILYFQLTKSIFPSDEALSKCCTYPQWTSYANGQAAFKTGDRCCYSRQVEQGDEAAKPYSLPVIFCPNYRLLLIIVRRFNSHYRQSFAFRHRTYQIAALLPSVEVSGYSTI